MEIKMEMKTLSVAEFRKEGYLQELNRQFLHPLGLALEVIINDDGTESFGEVWDNREDPEGMIFDDTLIDAEFEDRAVRIEGQIYERYEERTKRLGYMVQPAVYRRDCNGSGE